MELATLMGRDHSIIRRWEKAGVLKRESAGFPVLASMRAAIDNLCAGAQQRTASKVEIDAERHRNLKLDAEAKERAKKKDEGDWLEASIWLDKIETHIGDLRQNIKTILLMEQPSTLSGRSELEIRELNGKTYTAFCRRMQNAAGKLSPKGKQE